jgi:hypothetical protein
MRTSLNTWISRANDNVTEHIYRRIADAAGIDEGLLRADGAREGGTDAARYVGLMQHAILYTVYCTHTLKHALKVGLLQHAILYTVPTHSCTH